VVVLVLVARQVPALPTLLLGAVLGGVLAWGLEGASLADVLDAAMKGYKSTSGDAAVDELLSRGGLDSMAKTVLLILCAMTFGGVMESTGMLGVHGGADFGLKFHLATHVVGVAPAAHLLQVGLGDGAQVDAVAGNGARRMHGAQNKRFYGNGLHVDPNQRRDQRSLQTDKSSAPCCLAIADGGNALACNQIDLGKKVPPNACFGTVIASKSALQFF
jgi:Na+/H+ antiporter family